MAEFLSMGGFGAYVWPAYIISLVMIGGLIIARRRQIRRLRQRDNPDNRPDPDQSSR